MHDLVRNSDEMMRKLYENDREASNAQVKICLHEREIEHINKLILDKER